MISNNQPSGNNNRMSISAMRPITFAHKTWRIPVVNTRDWRAVPSHFDVPDQELSGALSGVRIASIKPMNNTALYFLHPECHVRWLPFLGACALPCPSACCPYRYHAASGAESPCDPLLGATALPRPVLLCNPCTGSPSA